MQTSFEAAINQICEEKHLDRDVVVSAIESAIAAAYRKECGSEFQKIEAIFEPRTGVTKIYNLLEVVDDVEHADCEISLKDAKKQKKDAILGDRIREEVTPEDEVEYGRIAAQTAKQVIIQRLQEAERDAMYLRYKDRQGEVINSQIQRIESNNYLFLSIDGATVVLYPDEQIPRERYFTGQRLKVYIAKVEKTSKGPSIVVSRSHPKLIEKLLAIEVPEIQEGTVTVKSIAREPGVRTKIAVASTAPGIDPVGSCVGQRGVRIQAITTEIGDEKIDIIEWNNNIVKMIMNTLSPAKISGLEIFPDKKRVKVYVLEDQRSLAIGKSGQNVRLASKLLGWEIDILDFVEGMDNVKSIDELNAEKIIPVEVKFEPKVKAVETEDVSDAKPAKKEKSAKAKVVTKKVEKKAPVVKEKPVKASVKKEVKEVKKPVAKKVEKKTVTAVAKVKKVVKKK